MVHWIFTTLEGLGGGLQIFFELLKQRNNVWGFDLLVIGITAYVLKCDFRKWQNQVTNGITTNGGSKTSQKISGR